MRDKVVKLVSVNPVRVRERSRSRLITFDQLREAHVGVTRAEIELINAVDLALHADGQLPADKVRRVQVTAIVDSGSLMLAINEKIRRQLKLRRLGEQPASRADDTSVTLDVVGPAEVRFENRHTTVEALVLPDEADVLLGAIPIEGMDVLIDLTRQKLVVNPEHPDIPLTILK